MICSTCLNELPGFAFAQDLELAVLHFDFESAGGEGSGKENAPRALADVDEAAGARQPRTEAAYVDVAVGVHLRHAEARHIEAAAIVEIELLILMDHGIRVDRGAEIQAALRQAADHAGLGGEGHVVEHLLLVRDLGDTLGHADAEVDHTAHRQLEGAAAGDDLALVEWHGAEHVQRHLELAGEGGVVDGGIRLRVIFGPAPGPRNRPARRESAPGAD